MSRSEKIKRLLICVCLGAVLRPGSLWACATCFGASDSDMARGMNWGILTLLVVVGCVLGGIAAFGIYLVRRAAAFSNGAGSAPLSEPVQEPPTRNP